MSIDPLLTVPATPAADIPLAKAQVVHARLVSIAGWLQVKTANIEDHPIDPLEVERELPFIAVFVGDVDEPYTNHGVQMGQRSTADVLIEVFAPIGDKGWGVVLRPLMSRIRQGLLRWEKLRPSGINPVRLTESHAFATKGTKRAARGLITLTTRYDANYEPVITGILEGVDVTIPQPADAPEVVAHLTPPDCDD